MDAEGPRAHRALAFVAVSLVVFGMNASVAGATPSPGASRWSALQARRFWTPARMQRARPIESLRPGSANAVVPSAPSAAAESPHRVPPVAPRAGAAASAAFDPVADPTAEATRQNGVIFFQTGFGLARCSGTSVNAPNSSVVITAGHCIDEGGLGGHADAHRWAFVPGYRYGQRPFGVFPAKWLDTTRQWKTTGSENFDVGAAVVMPNEHGQRLADAVGGAGIAWGLPARQVFDVHGYPVAPPFDGETQRLCSQTPFLGHDPRSFLFPGPLNLAVDCDVTGGASGGGWTIQGDVLNGVTNYGYGDDQTTDYGAYFGKEVGRLFSRAGSVR